MTIAFVESEITRLIGLYTAIERASDDMLSAALQSDWETVNAVQARCALLIDQVRRLNARVVLSRKDQSAKMKLMRQIVQNEAHVRRLAYPWTERFDTLMFGGTPSTGEAQQAA
jgi:flagellar protein FliT